jgi:hypothetical protein
MRDERDLSNDLVPVQIEDKATANELMMLIDTYSRRDIVFALVLFIVVIISTTLAGVFGPRLLQEGQSILRINAQSPKNVVSLTIPSLSPRSQFLIVRLAFSIPPGRSGGSDFVSFTSTTALYHQKALLKRDPQSFSELLTFRDRGNVSEPLVLIFDRFLVYDRVDIRLDMIQSESLDSVVFSWAHACEKHLSFQLWIRLTFLLALALTAAVYYASIRSVPVWTTEQKWTVLISLGSVAGLNPFFPALASRPTIFADLVDRFLTTSGRILLLFFVLAVMDYVGTQRMSACFLPPKMCFFSLLFLAELVYPLLFNGWEVLGVEVVPHNVVVALGVVRLGMECATLVWILVAAVNSFRNLRATEGFKFGVYAISFAVVLPFVLFPRWLEGCGEFGKTSGSFAGQIAAGSALALLMIFVHWPYKFDVDEMYRHPDTGSASGGLLASEGGD